MSAQSKTTQALTAKAHNVLFAMQGIILSAIAVHGDLASIFSQISTAIPVMLPLIAGFIHLIYHEKTVATAAYTAGQNAPLGTLIAGLVTVATAATPDQNAIKALVTQIDTAYKTVIANTA